MTMQGQKGRENGNVHIAGNAVCGAAKFLLTLHPNKFKVTLRIGSLDYAYKTGIFLSLYRNIIPVFDLFVRGCFNSL